MKFPWTIQRKANTPAEEKLEKIKDILFPALVREKDLNGDLIYVDHTCDMNMESVITDLRDGYNDVTVQESLVDILKRLIEVRKILNVLSEFDPEAKYVIIDSKLDDRNLEDIKARD